MKNIIITCTLLTLSCFGCTSRNIEGPKQIEASINLALLESQKQLDESKFADEWGELYFLEYEADFRMSGVPSYRFLDKESCGYDKNNHIKFTDLRVVIRDGKVSIVESHFKGLIMNLPASEEGKRSLIEIALVAKSYSEIIQSGIEDVLDSEGTVINSNQLKVERIKVNYFEIPRSVTVSYKFLPSVKRTDRSEEVQIFDRRFLFTGEIIRDKQE